MNDRRTGSNEDDRRIETAVRIAQIDAKVDSACSQIGGLDRDIISMRQSVAAELVSIRNMIESKYVTVIEFRPVKVLVFGFTALILSAVIGAIIALVIAKP